MNRVMFFILKLCRKGYLIIKLIMQKLCNYIKLRYWNVKYGENLKIRGIISLYGRGKVEIGKNVIINSSMDANPIGGSSKSIFNTFKNGHIMIKNNIGMSNVAICAMNLIVIEDDVMLGGGVKLYDTDFHSTDYNHRMKCTDNDINIKPILIKKGAFIGTDSIILKGVVIGEKSVVGAKSVVTSNIPDGEVWAGNPAKFIKKINFKGEYYCENGSKSSEN